MSDRMEAPARASDRTALWRDRLLRFAMGGGVTVVGALFAAVRNRWLGEHLAAAGIGVLAQIVSSQTWLATLAGMGLALPVARAVGAGSAAGDTAAVRRTTWTALTLVGGATALVVVSCLLLAPWVSQVLLGTAEHAALVRISMIGAAALSLLVVINGFFYGRSDVGAAMIVWAYSGIESATVPAEEVRGEGRTIRRGTMIGYALGTLVFLAVAGEVDEGAVLGLELGFLREQDPQQLDELGDVGGGRRAERRLHTLKRKCMTSPSRTT